MQKINKFLKLNLSENNYSVFVRLLFQGFLFLNNTFLFLWLSNLTDKSSLLLHLLFLYSMALLTNIALQLNGLKAYSVADFSLKILSCAGLLLYVYVNHATLNIWIFIYALIILTNNSNVSNGLISIIDLIVIFISSLLGITYAVLATFYESNGFIRSANIMLLILLMPYIFISVLSILRNNQHPSKMYGTSKFNLSIILVTIGQLLPMISVMLLIATISKYNSNSQYFAQSERLVAIGGTLFYFLIKIYDHSRLKFFEKYFQNIVILNIIIMIVGFYNDNYFISLLGYGVAGFTLSYGTINFNRGDKEKDIVAINGIAFLVVLYFILSDGLSKNYNDIFYYYILVQLFCFLLRDINPINFFKYITKK